MAWLVLLLVEILEVLSIIIIVSRFVDQRLHFSGGAVFCLLSAAFDFSTFQLSINLSFLDANIPHSLLDDTSK